MYENKNIIQISHKKHFLSHISDEMTRVDITERTSHVFSCVALLNLNLVCTLFTMSIWEIMTCSTEKNENQAAVLMLNEVHNAYMQSFCCSQNYSNTDTFYTCSPTFRYFHYVYCSI